MTTTTTCQLLLGDAFEHLRTIQSSTIDMVLVDLPYGTTKCKWDSILPLGPMWEELTRVCKQDAAKVFTASQPFTTSLIASNIKEFRYNWVWEKSKASGYLNAKKMPLKAHEDVCVFYKKPPIYNPQKWQSTPYNKGTAKRETDVYGEQVSTTVKCDDGMRYPRSVQYFKTAEAERGKYGKHPTQKPTALMEYLIKTYTNEGQVVLDFTMGSGTTGVACANTNRDFIGVELNEGYYELAKQRVDDAISRQQKKRITNE